MSYNNNITVSSADYYGKYVRTHHVYHAFEWSFSLYVCGELYRTNINRS